MSRPKPKVRMSSLDKKWHATEVLAAQGVFVVTHDGEAIGLRIRDTLRDHRAKYLRTAFVNGGHAFNLADRLNRLFKTDKFAVMWLRSGEVLTEEQYIERFTTGS